MAKAMRSKDSTRRSLGARAAALAALLALSVTLGLHPAPAAFGEEEPPAPPAQPAAVETDAAPASSSLANLVAAVFQVADAAKAIAPEPPALATGLTGAGEEPAAASPTDGGTGASQVDPDGQALGGDAGMGGSAPQMLAVHEAQARFTLAHALDSDRAIPVVSADFLLQPLASGDQPAEDAPDGSAAMPVPAALAASLVQDGCAYAIEPDGASVALVAANPSAQGRFALPASVQAADGATYPVARIAAGAGAGLDAETLVLPASVATIDEGAFAGNAKLQRLELEGPSEAFASFDGCLYDAAGAELLLVPEARKGEVRIAASATRVPPATFDRAGAVTAIAVEEGGRAFCAAEGSLYSADGATLLRVPAGMVDLTIADGCARVADGALKGCAALKTIHSPASVTYVSPHVFDGELETAFAPVEEEAEDAEGAEGGAPESAPDEDASGLPASMAAGRPAQMFALSTLVGIEKEGAGSNPGNIVVTVPSGSSTTPWDELGFACESDAEGIPEVASVSAGSSSRAVDRGGVTLKIYTGGGTVGGQSGTYATFTQQWDVYGNASFTLPSASRLGYKFLYYSYNGSTYAAGRTLNFYKLSSEDPGYYRTVYADAEWEKDTPPSYTVSWSGNGGTVSPTSSTVTSGSTTIAPTPSRSGYDFSGWYTSSSGGSYVCGGGGRTGAITSNVTYYAHWTARITYYTVTWSASPGTVSPTSSSVASGSSVTAPTPTRTGYDFAGWYTASSGGTRVCGGGGSTGSITSSRTYYAHWTAKTYAVSFNANGGSGGQSGTKTATYGSAMPAISTTAPTRTGYTFGGWYDTSASTGGTQYYTAAGASARTWDKASNTTLYARWTIKTYTVTFDKKGGTGGTSTKQVAYGSTVGTVTNPTLSGWTFRGYTDDFGKNTCLFVKANGTATARTIGSAKTLYANWTKTVTLSANNGTAGSLTSLTAGIGRPLGQKCTQVASNNSDYPIRSLFKAGITDRSDWAPKRTGYTFAGYYDTSASTGGTCWISKDGVGSIVTSAIPSTLYARWTPNTYTVSFNANGGSGGQSSDVTATYGSAMPTISATPPTKTYQDFLGWYDTSASTGGTQYYDADGKSVRSWDKAQNAILYARWTTHMIDLTFHNMGATNGISAKTIPEGTSPAPIDDLPSIEGWDFRGYGRNLNNAVNFMIYTTSEGKGTGSGLTRRTTDLYAIFTRTVEFEGSGATSAGKLESMGVCIGREFGLKYHMNTSLQWYVELNDILGKGLAETIKDPNWAPARNGYTFDGYWTAKESGIGTQYISKDGLAVHEVTKDTPGKLYAQWRAIAYALTYNTNGGTLTGQKATYTIEDDDYVLPTPTRTGYSFAGWFDNEALTGSPVASIPKGSMGDKELWAKWELATYRLAYEVPHGTHANRTGDFTLADLPIAIGAVTPDEGYSFGGWTGPGLDEPAREFSLTEAFLEGKPGGTTLTFAASVTPNRYELTLHTNDGTDAVVAHGVVYDAAVPQAQVPRRYGYAFNGYYLKCDDGSKGERYFDAEGTYVRDEGLWKGLAGEHLYAGWTLVADLDVPVVDPGEVTFQVEMASGNVEVVGENSGCVRSFMPQAVPLASVALETVADEAGAPVVEQWLGPDSAEFTAMEVALGADGAAAKPVLRFAAGGALGEAVSWTSGDAAAPVIPAATGDGAAGSAAGSPGELPVSYLLKRLDGFELPLPEPNYTPGAVGYVRFAVDLSGLVAEQF